MTSKTVHHKINRLEDDNFLSWKLNVEDYFIDNGMEKYLEGPPDNTNGHRVHRQWHTQVTV